MRFILTKVQKENGKFCRMFFKSGKDKKDIIKTVFPIRGLAIILGLDKELSSKALKLEWQYSKDFKETKKFVSTFSNKQIKQKIFLEFDRNLPKKNVMYISGGCVESIKIVTDNIFEFSIDVDNMLGEGDEGKMVLSKSLLTKLMKQKYEKHKAFIKKFPFDIIIADDFNNEVKNNKELTITDVFNDIENKELNFYRASSLISVLPQKYIIESISFNKK